MHSDKALYCCVAEACNCMQSFSHCLSGKREQALHHTLSSFLAKVVGHVQFTKGTALDCLALLTKRAGIPELHGTVTIRKTVLSRPPTPGHCTDSRLKHNLSLPVKKAYLLSLELHPEVEASGFPHI